MKTFDMVLTRMFALTGLVLLLFVSDGWAGELGYRTKVGVTYRLSATNVLGNDHIEYVSGPKIGRAVVGEMQYAF